MNGYDLTRNWYNFKFENPDLVRHIHSDFYFYLIDLWNRLGQKDKIGLPTEVTMRSLHIGSYHTYKKTLDDLIKFGFIKDIHKSKNQHQSRVVALSLNAKASAKALDKALAIAYAEPSATIVEQGTKNNKQAFSEIPDLFEESFSGFREMRKNIKKPMTDRAEKMILSELKKICGDDRDRMIKVLDQSTKNCWQDVYQLKEDRELSNLSISKNGVTPLENNEW